MMNRNFNVLDSSSSMVDSNQRTMLQHFDGILKPWEKSSFRYLMEIEQGEQYNLFNLSEKASTLLRAPNDGDISRWFRENATLVCNPSIAEKSVDQIIVDHSISIIQSEQPEVFDQLIVALASQLDDGETHLSGPQVDNTIAPMPSPEGTTLAATDVVDHPPVVDVASLEATADRIGSDSLPSLETSKGWWDSCKELVFSICDTLEPITDIDFSDPYVLVFSGLCICLKVYGYFKGK